MHLGGGRLCTNQYQPDPREMSVAYKKQRVCALPPARGPFVFSGRDFMVTRPEFGCAGREGPGAGGAATAGESGLVLPASPFPGPRSPSPTTGGGGGTVTVVGPEDLARAQGLRRPKGTAPPASRRAPLGHVARRSLGRAGGPRSCACRSPARPRSHAAELRLTTAHARGPARQLGRCAPAGEGLAAAACESGSRASGAGGWARLCLGGAGEDGRAEL